MNIYYTYKPDLFKKYNQFLNFATNPKNKVKNNQILPSTGTDHAVFLHAASRRRLPTARRTTQAQVGGAWPR
jgi:hypothetical protein